jgi:hypothetical protein
MEKLSLLSESMVVNLGGFAPRFAWLLQRMFGF